MANSFVTFQSHILSDHYVLLLYFVPTSEDDLELPWSHAVLLYVHLFRHSRRGGLIQGGRQAGIDLLTLLILRAEWGKTSHGTFQV